MNVSSPRAAESSAQVTVLRIFPSVPGGYRLEWTTNGDRQFNVIEFATRDEVEAATERIAAVDPGQPLEACRQALEYLAKGPVAVAQALLETLVKRVECQRQSTPTANMIHWFGVDGAR